MIVLASLRNVSLLQGAQAQTVLPDMESIVWGLTPCQAGIFMKNQREGERRRCPTARHLLVRTAERCTEAGVPDPAFNLPPVKRRCRANRDSAVMAGVRRFFITGPIISFPKQFNLISQLVIFVNQC
jgi:hypothetical protein